METHSPMMDRRPAVQVATFQADVRELRNILWGIEEEQIPFETCEMAAQDAAALAHLAAHMSSLNVGIGVNGAEGKVVLHHRDLPSDSPLFILEMSVSNKVHLRNLGKNAARLVKCDPLIFEEVDICSENDRALSSSYLDLIVRDVVKLLSKQ
jgi:hypothetical protein